MKRQQYPKQIDMMLAFLKGSKTYFVLSILFGGLASLFDLINPKIISFVVDHILGDGQVAERTKMLLPGTVSYYRDHLYVIALIVIVIALVDGLFRYVNRVMNAKAAETLVETMRNMLFSHIARLPYAWFGENATGDIIQRCTSDVESIKNFLSEQLTSIFRVVILLVLSLVFMAQIHPVLTIVAALSIPVIGLYSVYFGSKIGQTFLVADEEEGRLSSIAQENITGVRVVRAFGREKSERRHFGHQNDIYTAAYLKLNIIITLFWTIGDFITGLQVMLIVVIGAIFCVRGQMSAGDYIAFVSYNAMLAWPVRQLGRVVGDMSKAGVSIERIRYIMNSETEDLTAGQICDLNEDIVFDHVSFSYGHHQVLDDVSFRIAKGTTFGVLGSTGSGKSTLMYLLNRFYDLDENQGHITIGGVDLRDINKQHLRREIGFVLQEPYLFSRSIGENIAISGQTASHSSLQDVIAKASLKQTVDHFSQGIDTQVGERGVTLSGGQRQRVAIAQMLYGATPVMIFDDSLSAVDAQTDAKIRHALSHDVTATKILIAHRVTTLMNADMIIVMHQGRIVERGSHQELMAKDGLYKMIYDIQTSGSEELL